MKDPEYIKMLRIMCGRLQVKSKHIYSLRKIIWGYGQVETATFCYKKVVDNHYHHRGGVHMSTSSSFIVVELRMVCIWIVNGPKITVQT